MICYQMADTGTEQLNVRVATALSKRLQGIAERFNKRSKAGVAAEIIETYWEFYEELEQQRQELLERQRASALGSAVSPSQSLDSGPPKRQNRERLIYADAELTSPQPAKQKKRKGATGTDG